GGSRIATWIFQVLSNWHDFHLPLAEAVAAPRVHHQLLPPDTLFEEPFATLAPAVRAELTARGYRFVNQGWSGDIQAIAVGSDGATAISDPRGRGVARVLPASAERDRRPRFSASPARPPGQRTAATKPAPGCAPRRSPPGIPRP
ncbi:MAG: hypothetical protein E6K51_07820, partial [Gammaproteobacteria bacterium]